MKISVSTTPTKKSAKGNISLIMIFVLAIGSIMGLMSSNLLQSMIRDTSTMHSNYQSYYLAKAGIEIGTLLVNNYDYGFEDTINGESEIFKSNLIACEDGCTLDLSIHSRINAQQETIIGQEGLSISQCTQEEAIKIDACSSYILPLFIDNRKISQSTSIEYSDIINNYNLSLIPTADSNSIVGLGLILGEGDRLVYDRDEDINQNTPPLFMTGDINSNTSPNSEKLITPLLQNKLSNNSHYFNYISITNISSESPITTCLKFNNGIYALDSSSITSKAKFKNSFLSLQGLIRKELAGFVVNNCY